MKSISVPSAAAVRESARADLLAALDVACADEPLPGAGLDALRWLAILWGEGHDHLPLSLVFDLGHLLVHGRELRFRSARRLAEWSERERAVRLAYEDRLLARWAVDPGVQEAHVAVSGMPSTFRDRAVTHAVAVALAPLLDVGLPQGNAAVVRALLEDTGLRGALADAATLREAVDDDSREAALDDLAACHAALAGRALFSDEDLWDIAHLPEVPSESARRALRDVHAVAARIGAAEPGTLSTLQRTREVPTDETEADTYPTGGFDAISTRGSFENLVRSEVAYVGAGIDDDGAPARASARSSASDGVRTGVVDLFDVRFVEGELLFYTRDESPLLEARRSLTLVVDQAAELRHKLKELPAQTLVMVLGLCRRLQSDLVSALGPLGSFVSLTLIGARGDEPILKEELALLALSLRSEIVHRRAELLLASELGGLSARRLIVFSPSPPAAAAPRPGARGKRGGASAHALWIRVGDRRWTATVAGGETETIDPADPAAMRALADLVLAQC